MRHDDGALASVTPGDVAWRSRVGEVIGVLVRPLVRDGGQFSVLGSDPVTKRIVVRAQHAECNTCVMSDEALGQLLEEGVRQAVDPEAVVEVVPGAVNRADSSPGDVSAPHDA